MVVESSHALIYKQEGWFLLDLCKKLIQCNNIFDAVCAIHETQVGNDHSKAKTLYKKVTREHSLKDL